MIVGSKTTTAVLSGVMLLLAPAVQAKTWYTLDDSYQCVNMGSPADRIRKLASEGIQAVPSDNHLNGAVSVQYQNEEGGTTGFFFYPNKMDCDEMAKIFLPIDAKYE